MRWEEKVDLKSVKVKYSRLLYQVYIEIATGELDNSYQAGVFYTLEACGVGFRKGGKVLNNISKYVWHSVE